MGILARDTDARIERAQIEILKRIPPWRKLKLLGDACETNRALMLAGLRSRHPDSSEDELRRRLMDLLLGEKTATQIWGPPRTARR